jgi:hypothetical protein
LIHIFARDEHGRRAVNGGNPKLNRDPHFRDYVHFYEVSLVFCTRSLSLGRTLEVGKKGEDKKKSGETKKEKEEEGKEE